MAIDWLLKELNSRFNQTTGRKLLETYRENSLLWRELDVHGLPARWFEIAGNKLEFWHPAMISLFLLDESLVDKDLTNLLTPIPAGLLENAAKTLETVRMTGLEPATLKDATMLALLLREYRLKHSSWKGLSQFLTEGKTRLSAWSASLTVLPLLCPDFEAALEELTSTSSNANSTDLAKCLVTLLKNLPLAENEQFDLSVRFLSGADLNLKVAVLKQLHGVASASFTKLLANSLLVQNDSRTTDSHIETYQNLSVLHQYAGQMDKARQAMELAFNAINRNQAAILHKMALDLELSDPEEARKTWEEVLRLEPSNSEYRNQYAEFLVSQDEVDFAFDLMNQGEDENTSALFALRYPQLRDRADEAYLALDSALQRKTLPTSSSRFGFQSDNLKAAEYAFNRKRYKTAGDFIRKALQDDPNDLTTIRLAANINQRLANLDDAIASSALLSVFEPDNKANKRDLAKLYLQTKQEDKALEIYQELIDQTDQPAREDLLTYSEIAIKSGKPEIAIPITENFLSRDQLDGEALVILCKALINSGQKSRPIELLERASEVAPEKPASWLSLAKIWTELGENEKATQALRKAKAALPGDPQILSALGKLYLENDQTTDAIAVLKQAFDNDPNNLEVRKSLAGALLKQGYTDDAWTILEPLEDDFASDPELALVLGQTYLAMDDPKSARPLLQFSWNSLHSEDTLLSYANCLLKLTSQRADANIKELEGLLDVLLNNHDKLREDFDLAILSTDMNAAVGNNEPAYESYLRLLDSPQAKSPRAYHHLQLQIGKISSKLGMHDISLASLQEAMLVDPDDLETRHVLADAYLKSSLEQEAFNTARASLQIAPSDLENILWFSGFMSDHGNEREAIQILKDAIHLRPEDKTLYLTLARTYARMNDLDETKNTLDRMLTLEGIVTEEYVDVANLYLHLNLTDEASAIIHRAISGNPSPDFQETLNLVYSILRLGDGAAALQLTQELSASLGNHPCYSVLLCDVLTANRQFLPALESIIPLVRDLEFNSDNECLLDRAQTEDPSNFPAYTETGIYSRAIQLERITGDLIAAQKHADLAQKHDPVSQELIELQAGLALTLHNSQKLEGMLNYLSSQSNDKNNTYRLVQILCLDAIIQRDRPRVAMLWEHFLADKADNSFTLSVHAFLDQEFGDPQSAEKYLNQSMEAIEAEATRRQDAAFDISQHFEWIWDCLACGIVAWEASNWQIANRCFTSALSIVRINPIANRLLAAYLSDNYRQHNNAMLLHITRHAPELFTEQDQGELLEEQIAVAGRFLNPSQLMPELKIGQAVLGGHWDDENKMSQLVNTGRQAAQVLSVLVNPERIDAILGAYEDDVEVLIQSAIMNLHPDPAYSAAIAQSLLEDKPDNPILLAIHAFATRDQPKLAATIIERALQIWPDEPDWHVYAANMYQDASLYPEAAAHLEAALRVSPKTAHYWQLLGDVKLLEKDYHAAKDYFGKASDLFPGNPEALDSLAKINQQLGEHQIAIQCWQKAAQLAPENPEYVVSMAVSHLARKDYDSAVREINHALKKSPDHPVALLIKAKAEIGLENPNLAEHTIQAAKAVVADSIPFDLLSIELESKSNPHGALNALQNLADAHPDNPLVLNHLAVCQIEAGKLEKAEKNLTSSLSIDEDNPETLMALGKIDRLKGNLDQAVARLDKALKLDPSLIEAYLEMGQTYQDRREVNNAIDTYHKAIDMVVKDPRPYIQAATAYKESRDYRNAEYMLRQAAQLSPSDQSIRRQLAAIVALNLVNNLQEAPKRK
ncbi:MAG: tetratricopeptide repeat protein [Anaerolineaceae bacterium]